jgi:hypothetical protein
MEYQNARRLVGDETFKGKMRNYPAYKKVSDFYQEFHYTNYTAGFNGEEFEPCDDPIYNALAFLSYEDGRLAAKRIDRVSSWRIVIVLSIDANERCFEQYVEFPHIAEAAQFITYVADGFNATQVHLYKPETVAAPSLRAIK